MESFPKKVQPQGSLQRLWVVIPLRQMRVFVVGIFTYYLFCLYYYVCSPGKCGKKSRDVNFLPFFLILCK